MRRWVSIIASAAGCAAPRATAPANRAGDRPPEVELVVAFKHSLRFVKTTPAGLAVTRTVELPSSVGGLEWVGRDPVVMLHAATYGDIAGEDPSHDGEIARITAKGYEPFPALPAETWTVKPPANADQVGPQWKLVVGPAAEVWQGRCEWGGIADGGWCDQWVYARRAPAPVATVRTPPAAAPPRTLPAIAPSTTVSVSLVDAPGDGGAVKILRCSDGRSTVDYPPATARNGYLGISPPVWITSDPPMYQVIKTLAGFQAYDEPVVFEGCAESAHYTNASLEAGPDGVVAVYGGDQMSVRWRGRELGTLANVTLVRFAPTR